MDVSRLAEVVREMDSEAQRLRLEISRMRDVSDPLRITLGQKIIDVERWAKIIRESI